MAERERSLVVHGHFYQPPRENPWTELVAAETSAAPFHDWNERIAAECYRPNGWARIVDDRGRVVAIVNNYAHLSFNVGPTLLSWLDAHEPEVLARMIEGDRLGGGAIAQAYNHLILPLATERDVRTQVRWGLADFRHRFGRDAEGIWLPETAVNDDVLRVLAEEGVRFTILAPNQATAVRPLHTDDDADDDPEWHDAGDGSIDVHRAYRWIDDTDPARSVDLVFYDGATSHDLAFGLGAMTAEGLIQRLAPTIPLDGLAAIATDGETFGHHHHFAERTLAYALPVVARKEDLTVTNVARFLDDHPPTWQVQVRESAWSCAHGVGRWRDDCGCSTGGAAGADQRWRRPLRDALDLLRDAGAEVFERRGAAVFHDAWGARDAYVDVVLGARTIDDFVAEHVRGGADRVVALTLLEQQRHALLMYTSCAWFFWDLAGLETVQCLRYAARALDLLGELGEPPPLDEFLAALAAAESNQPGEGNGLDVWRRHVEPARVDAERAASHLALVGLLEQERPADRLGAWDIVEDDHHSAHRGTLTLSAGVVRLCHRRTQREDAYAYAAVLIDALEVLGSIRPADGDRDEAGVDEVFDAFEEGLRLSRLLRLLNERFGPAEFGLERALPDAAEQIVASAAAAVEERFDDAYDRMYRFNRTDLRALAGAGLTLPPAIRLAAQEALARRLEREILAQQGSWDSKAYAAALQTAQEAESYGLTIDAPRARVVLEHTIGAAVGRALEGDGLAVDAVLALRHLARSLGVGLDLARPQELVYDAVLAGGDEQVRMLAEALDLAVSALGIPR
jgi:hypothetical protein